MGQGGQSPDFTTERDGKSKAGDSTVNYPRGSRACRRIRSTWSPWWLDITFPLCFWPNGLCVFERRTPQGKPCRETPEERSKTLLSSQEENTHSSTHVKWLSVSLKHVLFLKSILYCISTIL